VLGGGTSTATRRRGAAAVLAALAFALALQGTRPLWDPDEGRYVDVALEMLRLGDVWTPHLHHDVPHYTKPPLTYWAIAASIGLFGQSEGAARLPGSLAYFGTILLVARLARRLAPGREVLAGLIYATSLLPFVAGNVVTTDTPLAFFVALGAVGLVELRFGERDRESARWLLWGGFGAAFLTKGPPGLLPLAALLVAWLAGDRGGRPTERRLASAPSLALFAALSFAWYAHEVTKRPDLLGYLLGSEVVARIGSPEFDRHAGLAGWWRAYAPVLFAGLLPWAPAAWLAARRRRREAGSRPPVDAAARWLGIWLLLPLAVFSLAQSRQPLYLLPLAVPAALLAARAFDERLLEHRGVRAAALGWAAALLALKLASGAVDSPRDGRRFAERLAARLPYTPSEVLFVEDRPRYSLAFYLGCEVEEIDLATVEQRPREPSYRPIAEPLGEELLEPERARVFLVPARADAAFDAEVAALGRRTRVVGEMDRWRIHLVDGAPRKPT
jgi:4-amino-4-deoxy-L-arabinose transferase